MASYTQNYQLHQWEPSDDFLRADFNEDFKKIDTALKAAEDRLEASLEGETARLDGAIAAAQQTVQQNLDAQVARLDGAITAAQQTAQQNLNTQVTRLDGLIDALEAGKAELYTGSYAGDGTDNRLIQLGFTPRAVIIKNPMSSTIYGHTEELSLLPVIATREMPSSIFSIVEGGLRLSKHGLVNSKSHTFLYLAFR